MRQYPISLLCTLLFVIILSGCGTAVPRWRDDALASFNNTLAAGSDSLAPEESDIIRLTIALAEHYNEQEMFEDADRLYRLSSRKSRLLYRNLIQAKSKPASTVIAEVSDKRQAADSPITHEDSAFMDNLLPEADQQLPEHEEPVPVQTAPEENRAAKTTILPLPPRTYTSNRSPAVALPNHKRTAPDRTTIYLTFDDGPSRLTLPIAALLESQGVAATFFVLGNNVKGHEKIISSTIAMGHHVGSHTLSHNLHKLLASFASGSNEVVRTSELIDRLGGDGRMVRLPYGSTDKRLLSLMAAEGAQLFLWDINSYDSTNKGVHDHRFIEQAVLRQLGKTDKKKVVLLFHDGSGHDATLAAIRTLIPRLKQEGYRFGVLTRNERIAKVSYDKNQ